MAAKAVTGLGGERAEAKGPIRDVTVYGITTGRWEAHSSGAAAAGAEGAYLEAPQPPPAAAHHHRRLHLLPELH